MPAAILGIFHTISLIFKVFQKVRYYNLSFSVGKIQAENGWIIWL